MSRKTRSLLTLVLIIIGVIVANIIAFQSNTDTGNIANETFNDLNYFFPATYVFTTIWPVIYAGIIGFAIYQALPAGRDNPRFQAAAPWMVLNIALNALWVYIFGLQMFVTTVGIMVTLLAVTVVVYRKLDIGGARVGLWERLIQITVSIYLAWLSVATVANIAAALISVGWNGFGLSAEVWALVMLLVGAALAVFLYRGLGNDVVIPLTYLYAYLGIVVRYSDVPLVMAGSVIGIVIVGGLAGWHFINRRGQSAALKAA